MNILIFYHRIPIPTSGGIARIISSLAMELSKHSHNIWFLINENNMDEQNQNCCLYIDESLDEDSKVAKVVELCNNNKIDVIINEEPIDIYSMHSVLNRSAILCNCKLISCFHNPVVSQVKNIQYRKEFYLQRKKLFLLYKFLSRGFIRFFLLQLYRLKYYKKYYHIVKESSLVVLLCAGMKRELQLMLGGNIYNSKIIPNFCSIPKDIIPYKQKTNTIIWCGNTYFDVKRLDVALKVWSYLYKEFSCLLYGRQFYPSCEQCNKQQHHAVYACRYRQWDYSVENFARKGKCEYYCGLCYVFHAIIERTKK